MIKLPNIVTIGIINDANNYGKILTTLWVNYLARNLELKFYNETDEIYFKSLINLLNKTDIPWKLNLFFEILRLKKKIRLIEFSTDVLLSDTIEGNFERANLSALKNAIYITNKSLTRPDPILKLILRKMGKRRFIRKVVRDPFAIVLKEGNIITERTIAFLSRRFKKYKIFYQNAINPLRLEKIEIEKISAPFIWVLSKHLSTRLLSIHF